MKLIFPLKTSKVLARLAHLAPSLVIKEKFWSQTFGQMDHLVPVSYLHCNGTVKGVNSATFEAGDLRLRRRH
jgi:hypothetical protein